MSDTTNDERPRFIPTWTDVGFLILSREGMKLLEEEPVAVPTSLESMAVFGQNYGNCLATQIRRSDHWPFPAYRFAYGTILGSGKFVLNFAPRVDGLRSDHPKIDATFYDLTTLVQKSQEWLEKQLAWQVEEWRSKQAERSNRAPATAAPGIKREGKTDRDRAKGKARPKS